MSISEIIFLGLLGLVVFGPKKLPGVAKQIGQVMAQLKGASSDFRLQLDRELQNLNPEVQPENSIAPSLPSHNPALSAEMGAPDQQNQPSQPRKGIL